jgi:MarR family transcriptional regulator, negative regulator of the multidrug operon emrRAB
MADDRLANLLGVTAMAAADRLRAAVEDDLGHGGAAPAVLVHLDAYPGESIEALRRVLAISQPATVRAVDRLAEEGLVERRPGRDRRTLALFLTARGRRAARRVLAGRAASLRAMLAVLDEDERARLLPLLERLASGLAVDRSGALTVCRMCDRAACGQQQHGCPLDHTTPGSSP